MMSGPCQSVFVVRDSKGGFRDLHISPSHHSAKRFEALQNLGADHPQVLPHSKPSAPLVNAESDAVAPYVHDNNQNGGEFLIAMR